MRLCSAVLLLVSGIPALLRAQGVLVAPHVVYLDHRTRSGSLTLYNPGTAPVELSLSLFFGYPVTDSAGNFELRTVDTPDSTLPSAAQWLQAFPRRLTLAPQERQTVRLLARPPAGLNDGEYWARLVVDARGGSLPVSGISDSTTIQVGLTLEVRTILPVLYRKGKVTSGVAMSELRAASVGDSLEVRAHLVRQGSAAFIGTVQGALVDSAGRTVSKFKTPTAVYFTMDPRFPLPLAGVAPGRYRLRMEANAERADLPADVILPMVAVRDSLEVQLP